jgi:hypothetical protein
VVKADEWMAGPMAPSRIEGFAVQWPGMPAGLELRYAVKAAAPNAATSRMTNAGAFAGSSNAADPYYAGLGSNAAPAAQVALFPQQTGTTLVGSAGMAWHVVEIAVGLLDVTWTVDGLLMATVPLLDDTVNTGNNIFFGHSDTNATSSTDPNDGALLFTLIDNISVTDNAVALPEPGTLALLALSVAGLAFSRRKQ